MINFFRKIRQQMLAENKFTKYLFYAVGEIVLVVIGILIALQINNWNEHKKNEKRLNKIYEQVISDIEKDIEFLSDNRKFYEDQRWLFERVVNDSIYPALLDSGISRLLIHTVKSYSYTKGINQLKNEHLNDSLSDQVLELYSAMEHIYIRPAEQKISADTENWTIHLRDTYPWYSEWMTKLINSRNSSRELQEYFLESQEYRNRVIWQHQMIYRNYLPAIDWSIETLSSLKSGLEKRLNKP